MRLILVRHGRTSSNVGFQLDTAAPGADLDEAGRAQADALVELLAEHPITAVYTSNLVRTQQTAAPVAAAKGLIPVVLPGLREISAGDDEMSTDATAYLSTLISWLNRDFTAQLSGGEAAADFLERFDQAVDEIHASGAEVAMLVSHGAALRIWASLRVPGFVERLNGGNLENTGRFILDGQPGEWTLGEMAGIRPFNSAFVLPDPQAGSEPSR